ncbi:MAG: hypothetical protein J5I93_27465 [Pirellulaceae bacterium]|nr:hypothetical protein [Pirellulaceae bacterium]
MSLPMTAAQVLDREYLELRAKVLELAASLDRLDRGDGSVVDDPRLRKVRAGLELLLRDDASRAERIQLLFSRDYDAGWRQAFGLPPAEPGG